MSAFLVESQTVHEIVTAAIGYGLVDAVAADAVGLDLAQVNEQSITYRYGEGSIEDVLVTEWTHRPTPATGGQVAKSLRCYMHQSCESPGWESSEARALCLRLAVALLDLIPGYDESEWR